LSGSKISMKKIIVFGATGGTGKQVVRQALENGLEVTTVVRNPSGFDLQHQNLRTIKGDVLQLSTFEKEIVGKDAVISCLGTGNNLKPTTIYLEGMENIISAMNKAKLKRISCVSAIGLQTNKEMGLFVRLLTKVVLQSILKNIYSDMRSMETKIENSGLLWTIVRPARLTDKPLTGKYRIAVNSHIKRPFSISRADVAQYMLSNIENTQIYKSKVEIAY
jgi:putative NADH-flavin reductase